MHGGNNRFAEPTERSAWAAPGLLAFLFLFLGPNAWAFAPPLPQGTIAEVVVRGNASVETSKVLAKIKGRPGRALDPRVLDDDVKALYATQWFANVKASVAPRGPGSFALVFEVVEMPIIRRVEFRGRDKVKLKELEDSTGLKPGERFDPVRSQLAVKQVLRIYQVKGFGLAEVKLLKGDKVGENEVVLEVFEGPRVRVGGVAFEGNVFFGDATLATKVQSRWMPAALAAIAPTMGAFSPEQVQNDARALIEYYQGLGFLEARVTPVVREGQDQGARSLTFVIDEGKRFSVRRLTFEGNKFVPTDVLRKDMKLHSGEPYTDMSRDADQKALAAKYAQRGFLFAQVVPEPRFTDSSGVIDLVYRIEEGEPYRLGELIVKGNVITRDDVVRREALMAGVLPGEVLNSERIGAFKTRLGNTQFFITDPEMGKPIDVRVVNRRGPNQPFVGTAPLGALADAPFARMQGPDEPERDDRVVRSQAAPPPLRGEELEAVPFGGGGLFRPPPDVYPEILPPEAVPNAPALALPPDRPPPAEAPLIGGPSGESREPKGIFPSLPNSNAFDVGPDRNEPFPNRSYADIVAQVEEGATGRFMLGAGLSSFGGLNGTIIFHERNFDLFRLPRSWADVRELRAFRGGGQDLRIELSPGTLINRALISFREPYLFFVGEWPVSLSLSGYTTQRYYPDWNEDRGGGRFALGMQLSPNLVADVAASIEDVNFYGFRYPAPAQYLAASGHTTLATVRPAIRYDTRNSQMAPSEGTYLEAAYTQGFGSFNYPKLELEGRRYFTVASRPDGTGKQIFSMRGAIGLTGQDTPVYEKFFAGDFRSMRGFAYRGVGPYVYGSNVGGLSSYIGSLEYQWPWTANDVIQQVVFSDFGSVSDDYGVHNFRVAVGTGARVLIPQFKLPIALDIAYPLVKAPQDQERYFTFFIGAFW